MLVLALIEAVFSAGTHETYQVPLGLRPDDEGWDERVICTAEGWTVYDGLADPAFGRELLHRMRSDSEVTGRRGRARLPLGAVGLLERSAARSTCGRSASSSPTRRSCSATR